MLYCSTFNFFNIDIFAMPSSASESFGVAALEASAMEVPVVATRSGGVPEVVVDGTLVCHVGVGVCVERMVMSHRLS